MTDNNIPAAVLEQVEDLIALAGTADTAYGTALLMFDQREAELKEAREALDDAEQAMYLADSAAHAARKNLTAILAAHGLVLTADGVARA